MVHGNDIQVLLPPGFVWSSDAPVKQLDSSAQEHSEKDSRFGVDHLSVPSGGLCFPGSTQSKLQRIKIMGTGPWFGQSTLNQTIPNQ